MSLKALLIICLSLNLAGCATNTKTRWVMMGTAAPVGAAIGIVTAPKGEKESQHAIFWAAGLTALAAIIGNWFASDEKQINEQKIELEKLKAANKILSNPPKFEILSKSKGRFKTSNMSKKDKSVEWKVYRTDDWIQDGPNKKYHRDMIIERLKKKD